MEGRALEGIFGGNNHNLVCLVITFLLLALPNCTAAKMMQLLAMILALEGGKFIGYNI